MFIYNTITVSVFVYLSIVIRFCDASISKEIVESWVTKLGTELWHFGDTVTRRNKMQDSFKEVSVETRDGSKLSMALAQEIKNMMDLKISAVKRIMDTAENSALASGDEGSVPLDYQYYNSKNLEPLIRTTGKEQFSRDNLNDPNKLILTPNSHFFNIAVNTSVSSVHVPTNVYDRAPDVIHGIKWSTNLDEIFINNYKEDPSLSWQYFGSSTGFMRQFPAMKWEQNPSAPVDLYDCRTRSWYIEAATSPKDLLILVDNSGSMMGQRKEIARHVVNNILDTLGNNDFVNIMTFVKDTVEVVQCFKDKLVQANLANIRELKMGMENMEMASNIANFSVALEKAFELLETYREEKIGAACNQAIMLVTDGVPYNFKEIFEEYNWKKTPPMPVRVFTYLIGREVADVREVKWMACANQGYYVHLSTMAEVREQVLQYVPVMARPMVLWKNEHPVIWTPVYADVIDPKMTDWLWEMKERKKQKERSIRFRLKEREPNVEEELRKQLEQLRNTDLKPYRMMTSVSMPVYDRRENASKIANLLGVAGTDVPNSDIQRLLAQHLLGVNAYAFIVTNNGYILIHPDLRPVFDGILKPSYNNIDVTDVEIMDDNSEPREFNHNLLQLRDKLINQSNGSATFQVKYHHDVMRRISRGTRAYYYNVIGGTPFELVVALPVGYGLHKVEAKVEIKRLGRGVKPEDFFKGKNWKIHPEWFFCKYHYADLYNFKSPEDELMHFLQKSVTPKWKWPQRNSSPPEHQGNSTKGDAMDKTSYYCDRNLFLSLVYDAKATAWFSGNISLPSPDEKGPIAKLMALLSRLRRSLEKGGKLAGLGKAGWIPIGCLLANWLFTFARNSGAELKESGAEWEHTYRLSFKSSFEQERDETKIWFGVGIYGDKERFDEMARYFNKRGKRRKPRKLVRWIFLDVHFITESCNRHFSEKNNKAIDETWYKRAVEQYLVDPESFVYSVPFDAGEENDTLVTATHAIFHSDENRQAPVGVVGYQFLHSALHARFKNITSMCDLCAKTCAHPDLDCFVLDNHGYVVVSEERIHTGMFFGEIKGNVMPLLVEDNVYKKIDMYDYQGVCFRSPKQESGNAANTLFTPVTYIFWFMNWFITQLIWFCMQTEIHGLLKYALSHPIEEEMGIFTAEGFEEMEELPSPEVSMHPPIQIPQKMIVKTTPQPCDMQVGLYLLETNSKKFTQHHRSGDHCPRPYVVQNIPFSNLVMVVIDRLCKIEDNILTVTPFEISYINGSVSCHKVLYNKMSRRRPKECIKSHPKEKEIKLCGRSSPLQPHSFLLSALQILFISYWTIS